MAKLEGRARLVEESRKSYEDRVRREEDEINAREQDVSGCIPPATRDGAYLQPIYELQNVSAVHNPLLLCSTWSRDLKRLRRGCLTDHTCM